MIGNMHEKSLPRWIKGDTSHGDKGNILYIEEWGQKRRFQYRFPFLVALVFITIGSYLLGGIIIIFLNNFTFNYAIAALILSLFPSLFISGGFKVLSLSVKSMPFTTYEGGICTPKVAFHDGFMRRENFIPWSKIESVGIEGLSKKRESECTLTIICGNQETISLNWMNLVDPQLVIQIFSKYIPENMDPIFDQFIGDSPQIVTSRYPRKIISEFLIIWMTFTIILLNVMAATFYLNNEQDSEDGQKSLNGDAISLTLQIGAALYFYIIFIFGDKYEQLRYLKYLSSSSSEGIRIASTSFGGFTKYIRSILPWDEIQTVDLKLCGYFYFHEAEITTTMGEKYLMPVEIFQGMDGIPNFERNRTTYERTTPGKHSSPFVKWNYPKLLCAIAVLWSPIIIAIFYKMLF